MPFVEPEHALRIRDCRGLDVEPRRQRACFEDHCLSLFEIAFQQGETTRRLRHRNHLLFLAGILTDLLRPQCIAFGIGPITPLPVQIAEHVKRKPCMFRTTVVKRALRKCLDLAGRLVRGVGSPCRKAYVSELDHPLNLFRLYQLFGVGHSAARECRRLSVCKQAQAMTAGRHTGPRGHARVSSKRGVMCYIQGNRLIGPPEVIQYLSYSPMHELPSRLGELGIDGLANQLMRKGIRSGLTAVIGCLSQQHVPLECFKS